MYEEQGIGAALLAPQRLWRRDEVLARPCPVPALPGVYAWYLTGMPARVLSTTAES